MESREVTATQAWAQLTCLREPRPNGSRALTAAVESVHAWLEAQGIPVQRQPFRLRPYFMELMGLWLALGTLLLALAWAVHWAWAALLIALALVAVPLLETRFLWPVASGMLRQPAANLVVSFPAHDPHWELVLCAHLDSKTDLLDHARRTRLLEWGGAAMALALVTGLALVVESMLRTTIARSMVYWLATFALSGVLPYGLGMGANLLGGRLSRRPSSGAVDDGGSVAVLLALAARLQQGTLSRRHTAVTVLLTMGEEAQMQGSLAYVRSRTWPMPVAVVNLELLGQNGPYLLWNNDGTTMLRLPADAGLNTALARAVETVTSRPPHRAALLNSDAFAFLRAGLPAATLGSLDTALGERGLHSALDHPGRVLPERLDEAVEVLGCLLTTLDAAEPGPSRAS